MILRARVVVGALALLVGCALQYTVPLDDAPLECDAPSSPCGSRCVALDIDVDHCGACGVACGAGEQCVAGMCVENVCHSGEPCDGACVDVASDPANCGTCGRWCDSEEVCEAADCVRRCEGSCRDEELCIDGSCACRVGMERCEDDDDDSDDDSSDDDSSDDDGECVDLQTDADHCGMCGRRCESDQPCGGGECQPADCGDFPDRCGYACTDVQRDPLHCGGCNQPCHPSQSCVAGTCVSPS